MIFSFDLFVIQRCIISSPSIWGFSFLFSLLLISILTSLCSENTHSIVFILLKLLKCLIRPRRWPILGECSVWAWEAGVGSSCLGGVAQRFQSYPVEDCAVSSTVSSLICCLLYLSISGKSGVEVSSYHSGLIYFSFQFYQFLLDVFWHRCSAHTHGSLLCLLGELTPLSSCNALLIPEKFSHSKICSD